jgi:hypothetical protein
MTMLMLTLGQAARMCGRGKTTLARAIKGGRLSAIRNETGGYLIDPAELSRAFPFPAPGETRGNGHDTDDAVHHATELATLAERVRGLEAMTAELRERVSDLIRDRDTWRDQAQRLALPAPSTPAPSPREERRPWWRRLAT